MCRLALLLSLLSLTACSHYEYDLIQPATLRQHVGRQEVQIRLDPVIYKLVSYDDRLVMTIQNPTGDPIELLGDKSAVVDPAGQSHPLRSQTIAAGSGVRMFFPPFPDRTRGPMFIIGVGGGISRGTAAAEPRYLSDEGDPYSFAWDGESDVTMNLVYFYKETEISQLLVFHRRRV